MSEAAQLRGGVVLARDMVGVFPAPSPRNGQWARGRPLDLHSDALKLRCWAFSKSSVPMLPSPPQRASFLGRPSTYFSPI